MRPGNDGNRDTRTGENYGRRRYDINGKAFDHRPELVDIFPDDTRRNNDDNLAHRATLSDMVVGATPGEVRSGNHVGKGPKGWRRPDERIREELSEVLARHPDVDASDIVLDVQYGAITISGTVADRRIKRMVEELSEDIFGVTDVQNRLRIRNEVPIADEIFTHASTDASSIPDHTPGGAPVASADVDPRKDDSIDDGTNDATDHGADDAVQDRIIASD